MKTLRPLPPHAPVRITDGTLKCISDLRYRKSPGRVTFENSLALKEKTMLITRDDFRLKASNFDLTESHNVVRILAGFMMLPHAASKFAAGGLNPGTVAFFSKAGLQPAEFMVAFAATSEIIGGVCLLLGLATRWAGLGVAAI